jgi:dihydroneopterin aldolase
MLTIHLKDLAVHAHHGMYEEEKILGNHFIVNLHVHYEPLAEIVRDLNQTVNYEKLFALVQTRMKQPTSLLETISMELCHSVLEQFHQVHSVFVSVEKLNPPIPSLQGSVVVAYQLSREPEHP